MALRSACSLLCSWQPRISWGCLHQASNHGFAAGLQQQDREDNTNGVASQPMGLRHLSTILAATQQSKQPGLLAQKSLLGPLGQKPLGLPQTQGLQQLQKRHINAWSPAQRYFVEGDHVVTAEATRHIQFTGLDSGSFYPFVVWTGFATAVAAVFVILPFIIAPTRVDLDKSSAYECGFDAFGEARQTFSVSFYLVSIMYLLFDIEIAYLFPYVMTHANGQMFWTMNLFLAILVAGFVYEWGVGALEWRDTEKN